jgi:hypothetical protein
MIFMAIRMMYSHKLEEQLEKPVTAQSLAVILYEALIHQPSDLKATSAAHLPRVIREPPHTWGSPLVRWSRRRLTFRVWFPIIN